VIRNSKSETDSSGFEGSPSKTDEDFSGSKNSVSNANKNNAKEEKVSPAPSAEGLAPTRSDFEVFVQDALGHPLNVFGRGLFQSGPTTFAPSSNIPAPSDYVIGPGDEIRVRAWGKIDVDVQVEVDRNGQIFIPRVGTLTVAGLHLSQLEGFIHDAIARQFKDFELNVTLGRLRSIQVFVVGQALHPGVYTISSLSTLVNALFASGGPSSSGTLRDVQVKRGSEVVTHFDAYALLLRGDKSADVHLLPGDVIYIPAAGPQIAVDGNLRTPGIFEMKSGSTIEEVIQDAGGLTAIAGSARAVLEEVINHGSRRITEFPLDATALRQQPRDGDILRIFPISPKIENAVTLRGNVALPGRYLWRSGMRVSDLIPNREFLLSRSYYNNQNALDVPVGEHPFSSSSTPTHNQVSASANSALGISTDPVVSTPGIDRTVQDVRPPDVANHDTEINWNYAVIERLDPRDLTTHLLPFVLGEAISQPGSPENKELQAGDVLVVYSAKDVALPDELLAKFVRIDGQVKSPGIYRVQQGETLRDVVVRAGGLSSRAYLYASQLTRESVRVEQEARLKDLLQRISRDVLSPANLTSASTTGSSRDLTGELSIRQAYIARLGEIHPNGRVVLRLNPEANRPEDVPDFVLEDGDHFFVPSVPNTVDVLGSVYNQGALRYLPDQRAGKYLKAAGGPTREADAKREFILRADGTVVSRQAVRNLERLIIHPGDAVVVPPQLKEKNLALSLVNWTQIVSTFALSALAIKALQ
jgi:protein involved in polysaccharide export with SLBB domain